MIDKPLTKIAVNAQQESSDWWQHALQLSSRRQVIEKILRVISKYPDQKKLNPFDEVWILRVLRFHENFRAKMGRGIAQVEIETVNIGRQRVRDFCLVLRSGERVTISWREILQMPPTYKAEKTLLVLETKPAAVKPELVARCNSLISFLRKLSFESEEAAANMLADPNLTPEVFASKMILLQISCDTYLKEITDLVNLREGVISAEQLGTARRFFNQMPGWATYGT